MPVNRPVTMAFERNGRKVEIHHVGPDYITLVDGIELPNFQLTPLAGMDAADRYITEIERETKKKEKPAHA